MKSLTTFIAEKLEESNNITVKENEEQVIENNNLEIVQEEKITENNNIKDKE